MPYEKKSVANDVPETACECACESIPCEKANKQLTDKEMIKSLSKQLEGACERSETISSQLYKAEDKAQVLEELLYEKMTIIKHSLSTEKNMSKENKKYAHALWSIYDILDKKERKTETEKEMLDIVKEALIIYD